MATFLGFLKNNMNAEEFVAPVEADSRNDAEWELVRKYPQGTFSLLTIYARAEVERIVANLDRWPGLPSKVQPTMQEMLARVSVGNHLPPMPNARASTQVVDGGRIEQVRNAVRGASPEVQELAARLLAAQMQGEVVSSTPSSHARMETVSDVRAAEPKAAAIPAVAMPTVQAQAENRPSLISVLKAMRG